MTENTLIFLHIPKTGGRSLQNILLRKYTPGEVVVDAHEEKNDWKGWPEERKRNIRYLQGHFMFGAHQHLPQECSYITMLREPVDRVISLFYFLRRSVSHPLNRVILDQKMDLEAFVESGISDEVENDQTRLVSGVPRTAYTDERAVLDVAKHNIENKFVVAGLTERFDETLMLLKKRIELGNVFYGVRNRTLGRPLAEQESERVLQLIADRNRADIQLYEYASLKLDKMIEARGESFLEDIARFKRWNRPYSSVFNWVRTVKNKLVNT